MSDVDIAANVLHHHSQPRVDAYERTAQLTYGEKFALTRLPHIELEANPFLKAR